VNQFAFLERDWPVVFEAAARAEAAAHSDPRAACFYARRTLELAVAWAYKHDAALSLPYQDNLSALVYEPTFRSVAGDPIFNKARVITALGNRAVHSNAPIPAADAVVAVGELFHVCYWLARTYAREARPSPDLRFDPDALPKTVTVTRQTADQLRALAATLRERDERLTELLLGRTALEAELARLREEVAEAKKFASVQPDTHDYSEAATRDFFIDLLLEEAGWPLAEARDREFEVASMPNDDGRGFVDYVLWGDDGLPLALVEAKRTRRDPRAGQQQAKLYADCLEARFGRRPVIFYSNGYEHWLWDDARYPPRRVSGFYKKAELELLIQRRTSRKSLATTSISPTIVERYYQTRAIRRIAESFERDRQRKSLLVMATGAGKTRTVIALSDLLMRANWAKRVLFLADRIALVRQATNAFKAFLPEASPVNLLDDPAGEGRVFVSTYPTMMGLIDEAADGQRRFGPGHFDLVVIDEAHRSVFAKYRAIFDYFDSLLVGLTATPKDEVDRNTYGLFDLETGVPTDAYSLEEAVRDGFLVPPEAVSVPLKFQREGIKYDELSEDEKDAYDALEWEDDPPDAVTAEAVNRWLFNVDTVDKVLAHLMERGIKVAGGDRLGKTIVFAKNQAHADFIAERFNANYPHHRGEFARTITFKTEYAQSLIAWFSVKDKAPHIAISVDMLDTGIDIPEVVNLVFFKLVRSKTKFWQMLGRGTRLCPDLFGPGDDKTRFRLFDYCGNLEYFSQDPPTTEGSVGEPLGKRLFVRRLDLVAALDQRLGDDAAPAAPVHGDPTTEEEVRRAFAASLHGEVTAMNLHNFLVRPQRRLVERFRQRESWRLLSAEDRAELATHVAGLPAEIDTEPEEAKRFDLLVLNLELALLRSMPAFERLRDQVKVIASILEEKAAIPMVRVQLPLIEEVQTDDWWVHVTLPMLERARRHLRDLVPFIEKAQRRVLYVDFEDLMGAEVEIGLPGLMAGIDFEKFRAKAQAFLREHQDYAAIHKLRTNRPLTPLDLAELERMLLESGVGDKGALDRAKAESEGLGLFVRTLVGLDRTAAKEAFGDFLAGRTLIANQIEFVNLIVDHLTEHGVMKAELLYESPFTDIAPYGPDGLFASGDVDEVIATLLRVRATAMAA
jgi:type I restriction enzyme, R subunit